MNRGSWSLIGLLVLLSGCATTPGGDRYSQHQDSAPEHRPAPSELVNPEPVPEPLSEYGNPETYEVRGRTYRVRDNAQGYSAEGQASWYGEKFHGHRTSSGEPYDMYKLTAAHKTLPLPTWARVTNLDNNKSTIVRINDRGPFHPDRIIDLSWAAAVKLDIADHGTGRVRVEALTPGTEPEPDTASGTSGTATPKGLYLQAGAFSNKRRARDRVSRLVEHISAPVALRPGEDIYRVWVGPFDSEPARSRMRRNLEAAGFGELLAVTP
jgi:rare lipoprotein A